MKITKKGVVFLTIHEAYVMGNDYYNPVQDVGIYNDFEFAKKQAELQVIYYDDEPCVAVYKLKGKEFIQKEVWCKEPGTKAWTLMRDDYDTCL